MATQKKTQFCTLRQAAHHTVRYSTNLNSYTTSVLLQQAIHLYSSDDISVACSKQVLHRTRTSAFSFSNSILSFPEGSRLRLLPCLPTTFFPCLCPSMTCFRSQFLHKMWPIQLTPLLFTVCGLFLSFSTPCLLHFSHDRFNWSSSILVMHHISELPRYFWSTVIPRLTSDPANEFFG